MTSFEKKSESSWGGARPGAGRRKCTEWWRENHRRRPLLFKQGLVVLSLHADWKAIPLFRRRELLKNSLEVPQRRGSLDENFYLETQYRGENFLVFKVSAKNRKEIQEKLHLWLTRLAKGFKKRYREQTDSPHQGPLLKSRYQWWEFSLLNILFHQKELKAVDSSFRRQIKSWGLKKIGFPKRKIVPKLRFFNLQWEMTPKLLRTKMQSFFNTS